MGGAGPGGRGEGDVRPPGLEREKALRHCNINLPDGSCRPVPIRPGVSIRELLLGLCQTLRINLAAVDLFLVGGEKPLVLDQDCVTLSSRDLRLEKRTLFRLDLVPINRSVGLKAKPTKPVTEVLRPVVAKYGLQLGHLVAKISGEAEPLDLGLPISSLDGLRVILDTADHTPGKEKQKLISSKSHAPPLNSRSYSTTGDENPSARARPARGPPDPRLRPEEPVDKRTQKKINIEEAEEFFDLISKAQGHRADDQRGLLSKEDLVLPDFLRPGPEPACSTPGPRGGAEPHRAALKASHASQSLDSAPSGPPPPRRRPLLPPGRRPHPLDHAPFSSTLSPIPHGDHAPDGPQRQDTADLTVLGEDDISSSTCTLLPPSPASPPPPCRASPDPPCSGTPGL